MAMDLRALSPTELVRLLNSTPAGTVVNAAKVHRQMNEAGLRITASGDPRKVNLIKYLAWLALQRDKPAPQAITYEERKAREAERNRALSRAGRDIGPPPPPEDEARRAQCAESFRGFCEQYFPAAFHLAWSDDHLRVIAKIERAVIDGGLFAFAMPRGSGKTTLARIAGLWAILYGYRPYVCLIGSAEDQAKSMLDSIKREMLANALLLADFPEQLSADPHHVGNGGALSILTARGGVFRCDSPRANAYAFPIAVTVVHPKSRSLIGSPQWGGHLSA